MNTQLTALAEAQPALAAYLERWSTTPKFCCEHVETTIVATGLINSEAAIVSLDTAHLDCTECTALRLAELPSVCSWCVTRLTPGTEAYVATFETGSLRIGITLCDDCLTRETPSTERENHHA